jgi:hypothetical protein
MTHSTLTLNSVANGGCATPTISLSEFYQQLVRHDWFYGYSEDRSAYKAGEQDAHRLEQLSQQGGKVYQWLLGEVTKAHFSGSSWNTPKHPMPIAPEPLGLRDAINLRTEIAKTELKMRVLGALAKLNPFGASAAKVDPREPILARVRQLGAYAGNEAPPVLIAGHSELKAAWFEGQALVSALDPQN